MWGGTLELGVKLIKVLQSRNRNTYKSRSPKSQKKNILILRIFAEIALPQTFRLTKRETNCIYSPQYPLNYRY